MVIELRATSTAPAAGGLNAAAWFDEWVELPHPYLGLRSPSEVLCTAEGLEAAKVVLRSLQTGAYKPEPVPGPSRVEAPPASFGSRLRRIVQWR